MLSISELPRLNASLNGTSAVLLVLGWALARRRRFDAHAAVMTAAAIVSALFLASYLYYHFHAGRTRFPGQGPAAWAYYVILLSHTILAIVNVPLVLATLSLAFRGRFDRHRVWARRTLPIWLYVSVTGVVIYFMLYVFYVG